MLNDIINAELIIINSYIEFSYFNKFIFEQRNLYNIRYYNKLKMNLP